MNSGHSQGSQVLKLKDSCDMCSASKVKCNKQKPICGRCVRLGHHCFYSPARRIGRPSSVRGQQNLRSSLQLQKQIQPQHNQKILRTKSEDVSSVEKTNLPLNCKISSGISHQSGQLPRIPQEMGRSIVICRAEERSTVPMTSIQTHLDLLETSLESAPKLSLFEGETRGVCQTENLNTINRGRFSSGDHIKQQENSIQASKQLLDCAVTATNILVQLESTNEKLESDTQIETNIEIKSYDAVLEIIIASLGPLSTILLCSCSKILEVAFLVISICLAVLDTLHFILQKISQYSKKLKSISASNFQIESSKYAPENCMEFLQKPSQEDPIALVHSKVIKELPKIAGLISQFPRFSDIGSKEFQSSELLSTLVADIKNKFQCLNEYVADW